MSKRFFILVLLLIAQVTSAQTPALEWRGTVRSEKGEGLPGATVRIVELEKYTTTGTDGRYGFSGIAAGVYRIQVTYMGYRTLQREVNSTGQKPVRLDLVLEEETSELSEVQVRGKSETQQAKELPIKAEVINTKAVQEQPSTLVELMNRSAGIRIRQTGGLGANAGLMMNGFQDRAIKNFKDGIPLDYLGAGYNIGLVPVNMLERVEVYKGVLPTGLGADALGGAVNMVTKKSLYRYAEASYEIASFNTHRASLNVLYSDTTRKFFVGADAFLNRSDNNYKVNVTVTDLETAARSNATVRLFHNRFTNYYAEAYGGFANTRWADELRLGVTWFRIDRQNQYGSTLTQPFGASVSQQYSVIPTLRYRKVFRKLSIDQFLTTSTIHVAQIDTARGVYDWYGNFRPSPSRNGEASTRGSLADIRFSYFTSRTNLAYQLNGRNKLELNIVSANMTRRGNDPLGLTFKSGVDILAPVAHYYKLITALGLESKGLNDRFSNNLIAKFYHSSIRAIDTDYYGTEILRSPVSSRVGVAEAVKFSVSANSFVRASAEVATRLPEQDELFGDGNFHRSNFELQPERSTNFNLGFRTEKPGRYSVELNTFYRITRDLILRVPIDIFFTQNQNVNNVRGLGVEADAGWSLTRWLRANGNFTWQDFRLFATNNQSLEGSRLRNTPYFFANLGLNATLPRVLAGNDRLNVYYYFMFVREYYLDYIPKALESPGFLGLWGKARFDAPNIIPNQQLHSLGLTYNPVNERFSVGIQAKNIFDKPVYDNFRIQNAGRSFHLKLNYILK